MEPSLFDDRLALVTHAALQHLLSSGENEIGGGSFGTVFRGVWQGRRVAVKKLFLRNLTDKLKADFRHEIEVLKQVRGHPCIVELLAATDPNIGNSLSPCLVFEYAEGGSLHAALYSQPPLPVNEIEIAKDIASGLSYLHSSHPVIWHRDLKSPNVLLDATRSHAKLCDFGMASIKESSTQFTSSRSGTSNWMAPEAFSGDSYSGGMADVYSFGCVLYELASKQLPWADTTPHRIMFQVVVEKKRPVISAELPNEWQSLIHLCWAHVPEERPRMNTVLKSVALLPMLKSGTIITSSKLPVAEQQREALQPIAPASMSIRAQLLYDYVKNRVELYSDIAMALASNDHWSDVAIALSVVDPSCRITQTFIDEIRMTQTTPIARSREFLSRLCDMAITVSLFVAALDRAGFQRLAHQIQSDAASSPDPTLRAILLSVVLRTALVKTLARGGSGISANWYRVAVELSRQPEFRNRITTNWIDDIEQYEEGGTARAARFLENLENFAVPPVYVLKDFVPALHAAGLQVTAKEVREACSKGQ